MAQVSDFAEQLNELNDRLQMEQVERKKDDQEIIDLLNNVCTKMHKKFTS
jgi:DNA-binding TFAR19-related protein (PDSD5 family)